MQTIKNYSPCPEVACASVGSQWVTFTCYNEFNVTADKQPTVAVFYSDTNCKQPREVVMRKFDRQALFRTNNS